MPNTGPPWFASDAQEAARALDKMEQPSRRAAFRASLQARLRGNTTAALRQTYNFMPLKRR